MGDGDEADPEVAGTRVGAEGEPEPSEETTAEIVASSAAGVAESDAHLAGVRARGGDSAPPTLPWRFIPPSEHW